LQTLLWKLLLNNLKILNFWWIFNQVHQSSIKFIFIFHSKIQKILGCDTRLRRLHPSHPGEPHHPLPLLPAAARRRFVANIVVFLGSLSLYWRWSSVLTDTSAPSSQSSLARHPRQRRGSRMSVSWARSHHGEKSVPRSRSENFASRSLCFLLLNPESLAPG
jgi:hypothetical protein